jgi:hypothetical protein
MQALLLAGQAQLIEGIPEGLEATGEALVGTYLKSLPDDGSADLADEMTPTVE